MGMHRNSFMPVFKTGPNNFRSMAPVSPSRSSEGAYKFLQHLRSSPAHTATAGLRKWTPSGRRPQRAGSGSRGHLWEREGGQKGERRGRRPISSAPSPPRRPAGFPRGICRGRGSRVALRRPRGAACPTAGRSPARRERGQRPPSAARRTHLLSPRPRPPRGGPAGRTASPGTRPAPPRPGATRTPLLSPPRPPPGLRPRRTPAGSPRPICH